MIRALVFIFGYACQTTGRSRMITSGKRTEEAIEGLLGLDRPQLMTVTSSLPRSPVEPHQVMEMGKSPSTEDLYPIAATALRLQNFTSSSCHTNTLYS